MFSVNNFIYRQVGEGAADILTRIHEQCFPSYWNREAFTDFFEVANTFAVLVEHEGEAAGMLVYRVAGDDADVITLAVLPAFRGAGIAKKLVEGSLAHCLQLGANAMHLEVEEGNIAAIKLYEQAGFSHVRRRKLYYQQLNGSFTDALVMKRKLA